MWLILLHNKIPPYPQRHLPLYFIKIEVPRSCSSCITLTEAEQSIFDQKYMFCPPGGQPFAKEVVTRRSHDITRRAFVFHCHIWFSYYFLCDHKQPRVCRPRGHVHDTMIIKCTCLSISFSFSVKWWEYNLNPVFVNKGAYALTIVKHRSIRAGFCPEQSDNPSIVPTADHIHHDTILLKPEKQARLNR